MKTCGSKVIRDRLQLIQKLVESRSPYDYLTATMSLGTSNVS